jgi:hypothetical protein
MTLNRCMWLSVLSCCRLQRVSISIPQDFPLDVLLAATTLDASQAAALMACLTKELAVVQGPPGCGELSTLPLA